MAKQNNWFTKVIADVLVTLLIASAVILEHPWLGYVVITYTYLMLVIRIMVSMSNQLQSIVKKNPSNAPMWFFHLLYGTNVLLLTIFGWFLTAAAWVLIWFLSHYQRERLKL